MSRAHRAYCLSIVLGVSSFAACSQSPTPGDGDGDTGSSGGAIGSGASSSSGGTTGSGGASSSGGTSSGSAPNESGGGPASGGSSGDSGGSDGSGGEANALTLVEPIKRSDSSYVLEFGSYLFEVDPTQAGIIVGFSYEGTNLLMPVVFTNDFLNGGSAFWLAPQDPDWGWPPPTEMDSDPYVAAVTGSTIGAASPAFIVPNTNNNVSINKSFSPNLVEGAVDMVYAITNSGPAVAKHSPWEISRVARGGITYWPAGDDTCGSDVMVPNLTDGIYFWDDAALGAELTSDKFSCDGSGGWLAHLSGTLLFVKTWEDVPLANQHETDKEIQLYVGEDYEEVEMRGAYQDITVEGTANWNVRWYVRPAPSDTSPAGLVAAALAIIQ